MKYDLEVLSDYINRGLVIKQNHPKLPLSIYNYSRECQYNKEWDDITLNCRGLVLDTEGNVIAKPFPKFFNYEEHKPEDIPNENFEVYEKMDGSLGIVFHYKDEWHVATRGSFTSEQAIKGRELLEKYNFEKLHTDYTYLFEIIYNKNRIVCNYDFEDIVLLGIINTKTGNDVNLNNDNEDIRIKNMISNIGFRIVTLYKTWGEDWETLKKEISKDNEGYVIRFSGGMRMKIKGDEYVRLHRILTNFSTKDIWELLRNNEQLEPFLDRVPDEFDVWVKEVVRDLKYSFFNISDGVGKMHDYFRYGKYNDKEVEPTKKEFAEYVMKQEEHLRPVLFAMWDNNNERVNDIIWKLLKPKYEKPFKKDEK
jgi:RNA ligase